MAKKTVLYDTKLAVQKIRSAFSLISQHKLLNNLIIIILGDVNDGTDIYATQPHHQAITNVEQQAFELSGILSTNISQLKSTYKNIYIECVPGNHGRAGRSAHEAANWDIVTYRYLASELQGQHISVTFGDYTRENIFLRTITVCGKKLLLYHGHGILNAIPRGDKMIFFFS